MLYVFENQARFTELADVILIKANEHSGDPSFKKAFKNLHKEDGIELYSDAWRIYILNLIWDQVEASCQGTQELKKYLESKKLLTKETSFFSRILYAIFRAKTSVTVDEVEYSYQLGELPVAENFIDYNYVYSTLNSILVKSNERIWVLLDRLDDAFPEIIF